jgi:hypothetical protein
VFAVKRVDLERAPQQVCPAVTVRLGRWRRRRPGVSRRPRTRHWLGDVLFAGAILGQHLDLDPERVVSKISNVSQVGATRRVQNIERKPSRCNHSVSKGLGGHSTIE